MWSRRCAWARTAVCIGRPYIWGLGAFGQPGVERVLELLRIETHAMMQQVGAPDDQAARAGHGAQGVKNANGEWRMRVGAIRIRHSHLKRGELMLKTVAAFDRIGEENAFAVLARATQLAAQGRDIINLGIGQPDFRTPDFIVEAAVKALRDGHHGYTPAVGILPLREAVAADLHKRFKVTVSPDEVMIMPGGKPTMFMSILMFGEPGAEILYPDPGFPIYRSMIEYTGARPVPVPIREENGFAFSAAETLGLITPQTRLLIVNSPANPTGGVTGRREVDELVAGLEKFPERRCHVGRDLRSHGL